MHGPTAAGPTAPARDRGAATLPTRLPSVRLKATVGSARAAVGPAGTVGRMSDDTYRHPSLPDRLRLRDRPGHGGTVLDVVDTSGDEPVVVAVVRRTWRSRRRPAHELAREMARGRTPELYVKEQVWEGHRMTGGRLGPIVTSDADLDRVLVVLTRR